MSKKVIVIGAGVAGLASACRLQSQGYDVTVYEKFHKVGGKMNQIKEKGYTFDVGPTILMMKDLYKEIFEYCGKNPDDYLEMTKLDPMLHLYFSKDKSMKFTTDLEQLIDSLEKISKEDTQGYIKFLSEIYKRYNIALDAFITKSFRKPTDFYNPKTLIEALKLKTFSDAYTEIGKFVKDEDLKKSLAFQTLYIGISPYQGPSLYTIIPMIELFYGVYMLKGGMYAMAEAMQKLFEDLGGKIHLSSPVDEILIKDKKAYGVMVNGESHLADYILCSADFPWAMKNLIPNEKDRGKYTDKKIDNMEYSCSCLLLYLGIDKEYEDDSVHSIYFAKDFNKNISDIFEDGKPADDPSFYIYRPSIIDKSLAPEGHESFYVLVPVPETSLYDDWSDETIKEYRDKVINLIKENTSFKDIDEHIAFETRYTPKDFESNFNAYNGATFGLKPTLKQSNYFRPQNKFRYLENLYFAGSSTHPGAGVPIVLQSAKLATEELLYDDNKITK